MNNFNSKKVPILKEKKEQIYYNQNKLVLFLLTIICILLISFFYMFYLYLTKNKNITNNTTNISKEEINNWNKKDNIVNNKTKNSINPDEPEIIEEKIYEDYKNQTNFSNLKNFFLSLSNNFLNIKKEKKEEIDLNKIKEEIKKDVSFKEYYDNNKLWVKLIKYLQNNNVNVDNVSYNQILNLKDFKVKISKFIDNKTIFEIPITLINTKEDNFIKNKYEYSLRFNFETKTISIKSKRQDEKDFWILYNGKVDLAKLIDSYVLNVYYYYNKNTSQGYLIIKNIDNKNKIWYNLLILDLEENKALDKKDNPNYKKSILRVLNDTKWILNNLFKKSREKCKEDTAIQEYIYPKINSIKETEERNFETLEWDILITCIHKNEDIFTEKINFN